MARFAVLREVLAERGWSCNHTSADHPLFGRVGLLSAALLLPLAPAIEALSTAGLVHAKRWDRPPEAARC